jgi:hypothetical protein
LVFCIGHASPRISRDYQQSLDPLNLLVEDGRMGILAPKVLEIGGGGMTDSAFVTKLVDRGAAVRTASRQGVDVAFDRDEAAPYRLALDGIGRICLVKPVIQETDFIDYARRFLSANRDCRIRTRLDADRRCPDGHRQSRDHLRGLRRPYSTFRRPHR